MQSWQQEILSYPGKNNVSGSAPASLNNTLRRRIEVIALGRTLAGYKAGVFLDADKSVGAPGVTAHGFGAPDRSGGPSRATKRGFPDADRSVGAPKVTVPVVGAPDCLGGPSRATGRGSSGRRQECRRSQGYCFWGRRAGSLGWTPRGPQDVVIRRLLGRLGRLLGVVLPSRFASCASCPLSASPGACAFGRCRRRSTWR